MSLQEYKKKLEKQLEKVPELKGLNPFSPEYEIWRSKTTSILLEHFDSDILGRTFNKPPRRMASNANQRRINYLELLNNKESSLKSFISQLDEDGGADLSKKLLFDYCLHPSIQEVSSKLMEDKHYAPAVREAMVKVIKEVGKVYTEKTGQTEDGEKLMNHAFGCDKRTPPIKFNSLSTDFEENEQTGIMNLFKGIVGIRNLKSHDNIVLDDPYRAYEYLCLCSLLLRLLDKYGKD